MKSLIALSLLICSLNVYAAQKVYPVSKPAVKLVNKQLLVEGEVKLSIFRTVIKKGTLNQAVVIAPSLGCHQTYLCFARNFNERNGQLVGDVTIDLDMDGNIDRKVPQMALGEMRNSVVDLVNFKLVYVDANRTIIEDVGEKFFFSLQVHIP